VISIHTRITGSSATGSHSMRLAAGLAIVVALAVFAVSATAQGTSGSHVPVVRVVSEASDMEGVKLQVDGTDIMVFGMNWGYMPIGENYMYELWKQPEDFIIEVLADEMPLLQAMGVNVIRQYVGIPPKWVEYIYETYGIYTVVNHPMARYGYTLNGIWIPNVDYAHPELRAALVAEISALVEEFKDTPGLLMWLLGNENNYGLHWTSFEAEELPEDQHDNARARPLYSLYGELTDVIHGIDTKRPVAIANGDLQYIDIIAEECPNIDILGSNVYRGISARDFFQVIHDVLGKPAMFTEFGADAWNAKEMREDQVTQARFLLGQWQEIYEQSSGKGRVGNAIGGFIFQWADGWWKFGQDSRLDIHDTNASWPNGGYPDFVEGDNNMNEEWWGICAKGPRDPNGYFEVYPRAAYYALKRAFTLDPYAPDVDLEKIRLHFGGIYAVEATLDARADDAQRIAAEASKVRVSGLRIEFETYNTGGSNISTPPIEEPQPKLPAFLGFDHQQSFYTDFEVKPTQNVTGMLSLNILGNVGLNQVDEIFYENRGRRRTITGDDGQPIDITGLERLRVYRAEIHWDDRWFRLHGYYRVGHTHWGYEGDFFGIYRDAFYGENLDIYNGDAPIGVEIEGKKLLKGFKAVYGPQIWWGANPQVMFKYYKTFDFNGGSEFAAMYQDEFARQTNVNTSFVIPLIPTKRATLYFKTGLGPFNVEVGGIWAGNNKVGDRIQVAERVDTTYTLFGDSIRTEDTFGAKARITLQRGRWNWYAQAAHMGVVADGGPTAVQNFTGWDLKESGWFDQNNVMTGVAFNVGKFQIGPNLLWQKPIIGPIPGELPDPAQPRNVVQDPFAVRAQRETRAAELVISYDPTPASWMWAWDNDQREDARLAWSLGIIYRELPTTMDAGIGVLEDGTTFFAFPGATPPRDHLWDAKFRFVSRLSSRHRILGHLYAGQGESRGIDPRIIKRYGGDVTIYWDRVSFNSFVKINDWGPYDYHQDFNMTFPVHVMADVAYRLGAPQFFGFPETKFGLRGLWRSLDVYSNRYCPGTDPATGECDPLLPGDDGTEWEIRTYMHVSL